MSADADREQERRQQPDAADRQRELPGRTRTPRPASISAIDGRARARAASGRRRSPARRGSPCTAPRPFWPATASSIPAECTPSASAPGVHPLVDEPRSRRRRDRSGPSSPRPVRLEDDPVEPLEARGWPASTADPLAAAVLVEQGRGDGDRRRPRERPRRRRSGRSCARSRRVKYGASFWTIPSSAGDGRQPDGPVEVEDHELLRVRGLRDHGREHLAQPGLARPHGRRPRRSGSRNTRVSSPNPGSAPTKTTLRRLLVEPAV